MESTERAERRPEDDHRAMGEQHLLVDLAPPEQAVRSPGVGEVLD